MTVQIGDVVDDKYRILRLLGEGGMGAVYEGENLRIDRRVAIKVLHPDVATDATMRLRFEREARAAGRIGSEHIVDVLDLGELSDGSTYMVMEYLEGQSLHDRLQGSLPPEDIFPILIQLLDGLGEAHTAGIIHRDLKPENVFLVPDKRGDGVFVKILDFGVSKFHQLGGEECNMTRTGVVLGTPYYMSPEQVQGAGEIDHRSDLFSIGIILYRALTGRIPFEAKSFNELMFQIALNDAPGIDQFVENADPEVASIVRTAVARDRNERYQSAEQFAAALRDWLESKAARVPAVATRPLPTAAAQPSPPQQPAAATVQRAPPAVALDAAAPQPQMPAATTASPSALDVHRSGSAARPSPVHLLAAAAGIGLVGAVLVAVLVLRLGPFGERGETASGAGASSSTSAVEPRTHGSEQAPPASDTTTAAADSQPTAAATTAEPSTSAASASPATPSASASATGASTSAPAAPTTRPPSTTPSATKGTGRSTVHGRKIRTDLE